MTIGGSGFTGATQVLFGATAVNVTPCGISPCFTVVSDGVILVFTPPESAGTVKVIVVTPSSGRTNSLPYTYT